ncbi:hypothetical protein D3C71_1555980 [compost metagenome]
MNRIATLMAISQAFGFTAWNKAPPIKCIGRACCLASGEAALYSFHDSHSRYAQPITASGKRMVSARFRISASNSVVRANCVAQPRLIPNTIGRVRRRPKLTPDEASSRLLGPGVIDITVT